LIASASDACNNATPPTTSTAVGIVLSSSDPTWDQTKHGQEGLAAAHLHYSKGEILSLWLFNGVTQQLYRRESGVVLISRVGSDST